MKIFIITFTLCLMICTPLKLFSQETKRETRRITENFEGPFAKFFELPSWTIINSEMTYSGSDSANNLYWNKFYDDFYDFTFSTKAKWISGSNSSAFGIIFRQSDKGLYVFDITQTGYYKLEVLVGEKWSDLVQWTKTNLITDAANELKVTCKESNIKCYINNKKIIDITNDSFLNGDVGFCSDGNVKCSFDDFSIGPPEEIKEEAPTERNNGIITENFNGPSSIFTFDENWKIKNGELAFSSVNSRFGTSYIDGEFADFTLITKAKWTGKKNEAGYGFFFRMCKEGGYSFLINQNGEFSLLKTIGKNAQLIQPWTHVNSISTGYNELKVTCIGPRIDCFINNKKVATLTDNSYLKGFISYYADPSVECSFDDFSVGPPVEDNEEVAEESYTEVVRENFDEGTTDFQTNEEWQLKDGALYHSSDEEGRMHWNRITNSFTDCIISVKTKWDGKLKDASFGILYGDRHCFVISQDGRFKMEWWTGSEWENLVDWQETDLVNDDYNSLMVTCSGNNIHAYLNNNLVINIQDDSYSGGYVGVVCSSDVEAYFDDFTVIVPNKNIKMNQNYNTVSKREETNNEIVHKNFNSNNSLFQSTQPWQTRDGALFFPGTNDGRAYWNLIQNDYHDMTISVTTKWISKGDDSPYGLIFGVKDNSYYIFILARNGAFTIKKWNGTKMEKLDRFQNSVQLSTDVAKLRIEIVGRQMTFHINELDVYKLIDNDYQGGSVGIYATSDVVCEFDDFSVIPSENAIKDLKEEFSNIIVNEDFDKDKTEFGLDEYWQLKTGLLTFSNGNADKLHRTGIDGAYENCTIAVKARWDGRATNNGFGIVFGEVGNEYYMFIIAPDKHYQLCKWEGSDWNIIIPWTETDLVRTGFNDLKITCSEKNIRAYINNTLVINTIIDSYSGGKVGLICSGTLDASFDDFMIMK